MVQPVEYARPLTVHDSVSLERLFRTSEYIYQRFTLQELPSMLQHYPATGIFSDSTLFGFMLTQNVNPPSAWLSGFGVSWTESRAYQRVLSVLLEQLGQELRRRNVQYLYYSGNDVENDWLRNVLLARGFLPYRLLYAYDKYDYHIPSEGNQQVRVRHVNLTPGTANDMAALLAIEDACFEHLWRYDATAFLDIAANHPYFVVAEYNGNVVGYQYNAIDGDAGYLIRIAVHPSVGGRGIGARLMAEAVRYFQRQRALRIMLNTQDDNAHAHRLYEWFDFIRLPQIGFVLRKHL